MASRRNLGAITVVSKRARSFRTYCCLTSFDVNISLAAIVAITAIVSMTVTLPSAGRELSASVMASEIDSTGSVESGRDGQLDRDVSLAYDRTQAQSGILLQPPTETATATAVASPATSTVAPTLPPTETPFSPTSTSVPLTATPTPTTPVPPTPVSPTSTSEPTAISSTRSSNERPILILESVRVEPSRPAPGDTFDLDIDVQNVGGERAHNVRMSLSSEIFMPDGQSSVVWRDGIKPREERDFETRMRVGSATKSGTYPIGVTLTWEDEDGLQETLQDSIAVEVAGSLSVRPLIAVLNLRLPGRVAPGAPFGVTFDLQNTGGREARNVVVAPLSGPLALHGGGQPAPITIGPGGTAAVALKAVAAAVAEAGATSQTFEIRYDDEDGVRYTDTRLVGISVTSDDAYGPLPMITSYSFGGALHPGEVFDLNLVVQNVGATAALRTFLALGGGVPPGDGTTGGTGLGVFAPLERSNRIFLDALQAGESTEISQKMVVDGAAKPGVYVLDIALSYDDSDGQTHTGSEVVTLLVSRRVDLEISPLEVITDTVVGQTIPFAVELINAGTAAVNVGQVTVVGGRYMEVSADPRFIGPLDPSAADLIEAQLTPRGAGEAVVTVMVEYLDDFNQRQTFEKEFIFSIGAVEEPEVPVDPEAEAKGRRPFFIRLLRGLFGFGASDPGAPDPNAPAGDDRSGEIGDAADDDGKGTLGEPAMEMEAPAEGEPEQPVDELEDSSNDGDPGETDEPDGSED